MSTTTNNPSSPPEASTRTSEPSPTASQENASDSVPPYRRHTFLSHNWGKDGKGRDNHARVLVMNQALEGKGIITWIDVKEMQGDIDQQMCRGIDESLTVIVFVTKKYLEKVDSDGNDNCKFEFQYAKSHKTVKNMILVLMEDVPTPWSGPVGLALGNHLYYSYKTDDELERCVKEVVAQIEERKKTQHIGPEKKKESIHACFVMPQPSSAVPSSHLKLKADLEAFEKYIKDNTKLSGLKMMVCGGSCKEVGRHLLMYLGPCLDPPVTRARICFVLADGFDKSMTSGTSYLDQIIEMKPKIVVLCASRGAERIGEYLSHGGVGAVFWTRFDANGIDRRHLFRKVWLPFCENLLVERKDSDESLEALKKSLSDCCRSYIIDERWHGTCGEVRNFTDLNALELDTHPGEGSVEILMSNFGDTNMVGFDPKKQTFLKYRASHLPWIEECMEKLKKLREKRDGIQYLDVKTGFQDAVSHRDFMILLCMCTIDDETLEVSGAYYLSQKSHKTRVSSDQIDGDENTIVWIDKVKELFPSPADLITWLRQFENHCITFLFGSDKRNNNEEYVSALSDFDGDEHTIRDTSASNCNMTSHTLDHHSRYQGTIKVLPPNDDADNGDVGSRPDIAALKKCIASLADTSPERIDVYDDDDGSMLIQVGVRNLKHLKELFHNLLNKSESLKESYPGARFSMESATALYKDACLKFYQLTTEQNDFIEDVWMDQDNLNMHLKGAAGTGKTFVALHCCLDYLDLEDTSETQPSVLFVCPTKALGFYFISWLLARVNNNPTIHRRLLDKINLLVPFQSEYKAFKIKMERNDSDNLKERVFEIKDYSIFGLIIVDEAQAVFRVGEDNGQLPSPLLESLQSKNEQRRLLLLSDTSQAQSDDSDIKFPFETDEPFELEVVSRSSENIAAASLAYQLGKKSKCSHGVSGPRVKVDLFDTENKDSVPFDLNDRDTVDAYALRVSSSIDEVETMLGGDSLHKLVAIILPDENFRNMLIYSDIFEKMNLKPVTAEDAMKRKGPDPDDNIPWVVVDTPSNLNGLEFLFVVLVGLDSPIVEDGDRNLNKNIQSSIYRGMSRGHYAVFIINHIIKDGWFEWLKWVSAPKEDKAAPSKINAPSNFNRIRDNVDRACLEKIVHRKDDGSSSRFKNDNAKTPFMFSAGSIFRYWFGFGWLKWVSAPKENKALLAGLDSPKDGGWNQNKNIQSSIYRGMSRGRYTAFIIDYIKGGWFEWLKWVSAPKEDKTAPSKNNTPSHFNRIKDNVDRALEQIVHRKDDRAISKLHYDAFDNSACHRDILNDKNANLNGIKFKGTNDLDANDEHDEAVKKLEVALVIARETGDRNGELTTLWRLGDLHMNLGQYDKAAEKLKRALLVSREIGDRKGEGILLGNLGKVYRIFGQHDNTAKFFDVALGIAREIGDRKGEGTWLGSQGKLCRNLEQYDKAGELFEAALKIAREIGDRKGEGTWLGSQGKLYRNLKQYDKAGELFGAALKIAREIGDEKGEGRKLGNLGTVHFHLGKYDKAVEMLEAALKIARKIGDRNGEGKWLGHLGVCYYVQSKNQQNHEQALEYLKESILVFKDDQKVRFSPSFFAQYLHSLYWDTGHFKDALVTREQASSKSMDLLLLGDTLGQMNQSLVTLPSVTNFEQMRDIAIQTKSATIIYDLHVDGDILIWVIKSGDVEDTGLFHEKVSINEEYKSLQYLVEATRPSPGARDRKAEHDFAYEYPYFFGHDGRKVKSDDGPGITMEKALRDLYDLLILPIQDKLVDEGRLTIIPFGHLLALPFAALLDQNDQHLIEKYVILFAPSFGTLVKLEHNQAISKGNNKGSTVIVGTGRNLSGTLEEAKQVHKIITSSRYEREVKKFIGDDAKKEVVIDAMQSADIIHLATHGSKDGISLCGLTGEDAKLTKGEVQRLDLKGTKMVVLSACDTFRQDLFMDVVGGMARSFLAAGSSTVIASLWPAHDHSAKEMMIRLYEFLFQQDSDTIYDHDDGIGGNNTVDVSYALQQVMIGMLKEEDGGRFGIRDWAPFSVFGLNTNFSNEV